MTVSAAAATNRSAPPRPRSISSTPDQSTTLSPYQALSIHCSSAFVPTGRGRPSGQAGRQERRDDGATRKGNEFGRKKCPNSRRPGTDILAPETNSAADQMMSAQDQFNKTATRLTTRHATSQAAAYIHKNAADCRRLSLPPSPPHPVADGSRPPGNHAFSKQQHAQSNPGRRTQHTHDAHQAGLPRARASWSQETTQTPSTPSSVPLDPHWTLSFSPRTQRTRVHSPLPPACVTPNPRPHPCPAPPAGCNAATVPTGSPPQQCNSSGSSAGPSPSRRATGQCRVRSPSSRPARPAELHPALLQAPQCATTSVQHQLQQQHRHEEEGGGGAGGGVITQPASRPAPAAPAMDEEEEEREGLLCGEWICGATQVHNPAAAGARK